MKNVPQIANKTTGKAKVQKSLDHFCLIVKKKSMYKEASEFDINHPKNDSDNIQEPEKIS